MNRLLKFWDTMLAAALAVAFCVFFSADVFSNVTTEMIAFFSIQSAVILPAMIFTAGILKPDGLEIHEAIEYHKALKRQMVFWVALLGLDFVAVVSLIVGKAASWSIIVDLSIVEPDLKTDLVSLVIFVLVFAGSLAVFRTIPFVRGVISLLDLNAEITQKAIARRNRLEAESRKRELDKSPLQLPTGFGKIVD